MSMGPAPDLTGNVTAMASCCTDCGSGGDPSAYREYGGRPAVVGAPPPSSCVSGTCNATSSVSSVAPMTASAGLPPRPVG
jgi:hypothetical protein